MGGNYVISRPISKLIGKKLITGKCICSEGVAAQDKPSEEGMLCLVINGVLWSSAGMNTENKPERSVKRVAPEELCSDHQQMAVVEIPARGTVQFTYLYPSKKSKWSVETLIIVGEEVIVITWKASNCREEQCYVNDYTRALFIWDNNTELTMAGELKKIPD